ncbi:MAG TPA: pirin family protein [Alcanivoracaceae bacterium]|nr:pirin family protein [Alcanivoracaceae bacterium]
MRILTAKDIPITGFAGIRERVFIQDRSYFSHLVPDECWDGFGPLVYLADAWFNPNKSTGLHHHSNVDIVSVLPRGSMYHAGSIGDGKTITAGQAQIQRSGSGQFSHNEINPNNSPQPFVQIWLTPGAQEAPSYEIMDLNPDGTSVVIQREQFELGVGLWHTPQQWQGEQEGLLYLISGEGTLTLKDGTSTTLQAGSLVKAAHMHFAAEQAQFFYATHNL